MQEAFVHKHMSHAEPAKLGSGNAELVCDDI